LSRKKKMAVRYARRSVKAKGRRITSPETQLTECAEHAEEQGYDLWPEVYVDPDVSAYRRSDGKLKNRPGWMAMANAIRTGQIDVVVCWDVNRLTRDAEVGIEFAKLCRQFGVDVEDTRDVRYKLSTPTGYADFIAVCTAAQRDSAAKSEVVSRELGTAAREGAPAGGGAGFGYSRTNRSTDTEPSLTLDEEQASLLRRAITAVLEGGSLRDASRIVRPLWSNVRPNSIRKTLLSPRIAGLRQHDGEFYPAQWPGVVDRKTWERVVEILTSEERRTVGRPAEYLLAGGCVQTACGGNLVSRAGGKNHRRAYRCGKDFCSSRDKERFEDFVTALVFEVVDGGALKRLSAALEAADGQVERITAKRRELRAKKERLVDGFEDGLITKAQLKERTAKADAELERLVMPSRQGRELPDEETFPEWWDDASLDTKRWLIQSMFQITVYPAGKGNRSLQPIEVQRLV